MLVTGQQPWVKIDRELSMPLKILFIGDVVGSPGRKIVAQVLPRLIPRWGIGLVVCNAENAAGGSGLTIKCHEELVEAGVDVFTLGDHVYRKDEVFTLFERTNRLCRPANFPPDAPGAESALVEARDGTAVGVFTVLGRTFMRPVDCPFRAADRVLDGLRGAAPVIVVDMHAEATSDKQLFGRYLDGRVSAVLGTHTHVATADEQILPLGTAYQSDVGMTGPYDSILGRRVDRVLESTLTFVPHFYDVATGDPRLCGALVEVDPATGHALAIRRVSINQAEAQRLLTGAAPEGGRVDAEPT
jgi:2',3'-cyclic-nucleotide 2'-phosphodiesterase